MENEFLSPILLLSDTRPLHHRSSRLGGHHERSSGRLHHGRRARRHRRWRHRYRYGWLARTVLVALAVAGVSRLGSRVGDRRVTRSSRSCGHSSVRYRVRFPSTAPATRPVPRAFRRAGGPPRGTGDSSRPEEGRVARKGRPGLFSRRRRRTGARETTSGGRRVILRDRSGEGGRSRTVRVRRGPPARCRAGRGGPDPSPTTAGLLYPGVVCRDAARCGEYGKNRAAERTAPGPIGRSSREGRSGRARPP